MTNNKCNHLFSNYLKYCNYLFWMLFCTYFFQLTYYILFIFLIIVNKLVVYVDMMWWLSELLFKFGPKVVLLQREMLNNSFLSTSSIRKPRTIWACIILICPKHPTFDMITSMTCRPTQNIISNPSKAGILVNTHNPEAEEWTNFSCFPFVLRNYEGKISIDMLEYLQYLKENNYNIILKFWEKEQARTSNSQRFCSHKERVVWGIFSHVSKSWPS